MPNKNYSKKEIRNILIVIKWYYKSSSTDTRKGKKLLELLCGGSFPEKNLPLINDREKMNREEPLNIRKENSMSV